MIFLVDGLDSFPSSSTLLWFSGCSLSTINKWSYPYNLCKHVCIRYGVWNTDLYNGTRLGQKYMPAWNLFDSIVAKFRIYQNLTYMIFQNFSTRLKLKSLVPIPTEDQVQLSSPTLSWIWKYFLVYSGQLLQNSRIILGPWVTYVAPSFKSFFFGFYLPELLADICEKM